METKKIYYLYAECGEVDMAFLNKSDCEEMALAYFQQYSYERFMYEYNKCADIYGYPEYSYIDPSLFPAHYTREDILKELWTERMKKAEETTLERIFTYEIDLVLN